MAIKTGKDVKYGDNALVPHPIATKTENGMSVCICGQWKFNGQVLHDDIECPKCGAFYKV